MIQKQGNDRIKLFALGGLSETGKNSLVIEINDDIFVIDAGMKYPDPTARGIDLVIPNYTYLKDNKHRVRCYIATHGHDDMIGALNYFVREVPAVIICSEITRQLIELSNKKYNLGAKHKYQIVRPTTQIEVAGRKIILYRTTHSIFDSFGVAIETDAGYIVYSSDYMLDYSAKPQYATDLKMLSHLSEQEILCLLIESSAAKEKGSASPNHLITPHISRVFQETTGRLFITFYDNNFYGISEAIDLAIKCEKKIFFLQPEMRDLVQKMHELRALFIPPMTLASADEVYKSKRNNIAIFVTGGGSSLFHTLERLSGEEKHTDHITLDSEDTIVLAAPYFPGNELKAIKAINDVYRSGAKVVDLKRKKIAGMHPRAEDIKMIISLLKPRYYMPIKGEYSDLIANAQHALSMGYNHSNVLVFENGDVVKFQNGRFMLSEEKVINGDLLVDGLGVGDVGSVVISDRDRISNEGVLIIATTVNKKTREVITSVDTQSRGLIFVNSSESLLLEASELFMKILMEHLKHDPDPVDFNVIKLEMRDKIVRFVKKEIGKEPMVLPVIIEI